MSFNSTIEKAIEIVGNQAKLGELIGETQSHISGFKNGVRPCGLKKRLQIAEIAGVDRVRTMIEYFADSLDEHDIHEGEAKRLMDTILESFPSETDKAPRKHRHATMDLLNSATKIKDLAAWADELGLSKQAIYNAKYREHLSPAIAGALAEKLGEDVDHWIAVAALESEKDSTCKDRMLKRYRK